MPEESDEGANVYQTFHGRASVQVLLVKQDPPSLLFDDQTIDDNIKI